MDEAVKSWREGRASQGNQGADQGGQAAPDFGAGAGRGLGLQAEPSMTDRLRADALGVDVSQLPTNMRTPTGGTDAA
jgi:hypothetical protein